MQHNTFFKLSFQADETFFKVDKQLTFEKRRQICACSRRTRKNLLKIDGHELFTIYVYFVQCLPLQMSILDDEKGDLLKRNEFECFNGNAQWDQPFSSFFFFK